MNAYFEGITVPVVTPCTEDGRLNEKRLCEHIQFLERAGVKGIFVGGTTGEFINFSAQERQQQLTVALQSVEKIDVLYNITSMDRQEMENHIRFAREHGVRCVSVTAPYYHKYDKAALIEYFAAVSKLTEGLALFVYNMPGMTGNPVTPELLSELIQRCPNLKGVKDSSMDFTNLQEFYISAPDGFEIITGNDAEILASLHLGCNGAIVALANVYPELCVGVYECYQDGKLSIAQQYQAELIKLRKACRSTIPIVSHKYLLELRGMSVGGAHFPMRDLTEAEKSVLRSAARSAERLLQERSVIVSSQLLSI